MLSLNTVSPQKTIESNSSSNDLDSNTNVPNISKEMTAPSQSFMTGEESLPHKQRLNDTEESNAPIPSASDNQTHISKPKEQNTIDQEALNRLKPADPNYFYGRFNLFVGKMLSFPNESLFQSNILLNDDQNLSDDQPARHAILLSKELPQELKLLISEAFFDPIWNATKETGPILQAIARDFSDKARLNLPQPTHQLEQQLNVLGAKNFLKLQLALLNHKGPFNRGSIAAYLQDRRVEIKQSIAAGGTWPLLKDEAIYDLASFLNPQPQYSNGEPSSTDTVNGQEAATFRILLAFLAHHVQPEELGLSQNCNLDKKINRLIELTAEGLLKKGAIDRFFDPMRLPLMATLSDVDCLDILFLRKLFIQRRDELSEKLNKQINVLNRLATLGSTDLKDKIEHETKQGKSKLSQHAQTLDDIFSPLLKLAKFLGNTQASYLLDIGNIAIKEEDDDDDDYIGNISTLTDPFEKLTEAGKLATFLSSFKKIGIHEAERLQVLSNKLDQIRATRYIHMLAAKTLWFTYHVPPANKDVDNHIIPPNQKNEIIALLNAIQTNPVTQPSNQAQLTHTVLNAIPSTATVQDALLKHFQDQFNGALRDLVNRYKLKVPGCSLLRPMVESLVQKQCNKVEQDLKQFWVNNLSDHKLNACENLNIERFIKISRKGPEKIVMTQLKEEIESYDGNRDIIDFICIAITAQTGFAKTMPIDVERFDERYMKLQEVETALRNGRDQCSRNIIDIDIDIDIADRETLAKYLSAFEILTLLYGRCTALVMNTDVSNMSWGKRVTQIEATKDLKKLDDIIGVVDPDNVQLRDQVNNLAPFMDNSDLKSILDIISIHRGKFLFLLAPDECDECDECASVLRMLLMLKEDYNLFTTEHNFLPNTLQSRLPQNVVDSQYYKGSPDNLNQHLKTLATAQTFVLTQLPALVEELCHDYVSDDLARKHTELLLPLERLASSLLPQQACPIIQQINKDIIGLLNYAINTHFSQLEGIAASIIARSVVRDRSGEDANQMGMILTNTDRLAHLLSKPFRDQYEVVEAAKALIKDVLPMKHNSKYMNTDPAHSALMILDHVRLKPVYKKLVRQAEDSIESIQLANALSEKIADFTNFTINMPNIDEMVTLRSKLKHAPENKEQWVNTAVKEKLEAALTRMKPPENINDILIWSQRIDLLCTALKELKETDSVSALDFASPAIQAEGGMNARYLYRDDDVLNLMNIAIVNAKADNNIPLAERIMVAPSAISTPDTLKDFVTDWLEEKLASDTPCLYIIPYSPIKDDGSNSLHWTVIILHLAGDNRLTVNYMDPLDANSNIPIGLVQNMHSIVQEFNTNNSSPDSSVINAQPNFVGIKHSSQKDATSCGPRIVEDTSNMIQLWIIGGQLPTKVPPINDIDINRVRQLHLEQLGGLESEFGHRQLWNLISEDGTDDVDVKALEAQDRLRNALVDDILSIQQRTNHADHSQKFQDFISSPSVDGWIALTENKTIYRLLQTETLLAHDQIIKQSVAIAKHTLPMKASLDLLYKMDLETVGTLMSLKEKMLSTKEDHSKMLSSELRSAMHGFIEHVKKNGLPLAEADKAIRGFYPDFKGIDSDPSLDLPCEYDALLWALQSIELSKTDYVQNVINEHYLAHQALAEKTETDANDYKWLNALHEKHEALTNNEKDVSLLPCWLLMNQQLNKHGDTPLLKSLFPSELRSKLNESTEADIPKVYDDALVCALSQINNQWLNGGMSGWMSGNRWMSGWGKNG